MHEAEDFDEVPLIALAIIGVLGLVIAIGVVLLLAPHFALITQSGPH